MPSRHTPIACFDARSLLLIASLTLGGTSALQAQTSVAPAKAESPFSSGPRTTPAATASEAFDRADTNKDGQLSEQEAARLPAISLRFKALDADSNGSLSRAEFDKGAQP